MTAATPGQAHDVPESVLRDRHVGSEFSRWTAAQGYPGDTGGRPEYAIGDMAEAFAAGFASAEETATELRDCAAQDAQPAPGEQCGTCDGSGMITAPDSDGESASEEPCPDPVHDGDDWFGVGNADAGAPAPELAAAMRKIRTALEDSPTAAIARREALEIVNALELGLPS